MISPSLSNQASTYMLGLSDIPHPCEKDTQMDILLGEVIHVLSKSIKYLSI